MIGPRRTAPAGLTLIELVMVIALVGAISVSLTMAASTVLARSSETHSKEQGIYTAHHLLHVVEQAVRLAESVHQAGDDLLVVSTRYYHDADDTLERIRFSRSGTSLLREISQNDGASYGPAEVIDDNVASFSAHSVRISDPFDASDYDSGFAAIPSGDPLPVDTAAQVEYLVRDLDGVDPDLVDSYDAGRLQIVTTNVTSKTVTVSPPLAKDDLHLCLQFTPGAAGAAFTPLQYGNAANGVSVDFSDSGQVTLTSTESSTAIATEVGGLDWSAGVTYSVELRFRANEVWAHVATAGGVTVLSRVVPTAAALDSAAVHLSAHTPNQAGSWDDLRVEYEVVTLNLGVDVGTGVESLSSKVAPRTW